MTFTHALATNNYGPAKFIVDASAANGTHTTIAAALTSASSGDTIFIRPGTYTENLTLKAGVNLTGYGCDASPTGLSTVIISGKATFTAAGTVNISNLQLQTNSDFFLAVTGSANSIVNINNAYLNMSNNTGISYTTSGTGSNINIRNCVGNLGTTGIAVFAHSGGSNINFGDTSINNTGGSSTASTCSSGAVTLTNTYLSNPVTCSGTGSFNAQHSAIDSNATNSTALTTVAGQQHTLYYVRLASGSATPISVGGTVITDALTLSHTNAAATGGAGTLTYNSIFQDQTVGTLSTTTLTPKGHVGMQNSTAPAAGYIGERISANITTPVVLANATAKTITSIALTPGIWDVSGMGVFTGVTAATLIFVAVSANNNSFTGTVVGLSAYQSPTRADGFTVSDQAGVVPPFRVSLSANATYYLVGQLNFTVGASPGGYGGISATRVA